MMLNKICYYFLLFLIYSVIGWVCEVIVAFFKHRRFVNRGFLIGPYCPIYGVGVLLIIAMIFLVFFNRLYKKVELNE